MRSHPSAERGDSEPLSSRARAILEADGKITKGPWFSIEQGWSGSWLFGPATGRTLGGEHILSSSAEGCCCNQPTAAFISLARNDSSAIAKAYLEGEEILRKLAEHADADLPRRTLEDLAESARAWLQRHEAEGV